MKPMQS
ncbi:hypothetical protein Ctob_009942, partial [Chrysochromulina tobinii]